MPGAQESGQDFLEPEWISEIKKRPPVREGRSKRVWRIDNDLCLVELKPTLRSFTFAREETVPGTDVLRMSFFAYACGVLSRVGIQHAFRYRIDERSYASRFCEEPPVEVIVKNYAVGSTQVLYPGLFESGMKFSFPVVKFDFRAEPQDLPLPDDYLRELGLPAGAFRETALQVNRALASALPQFNIIDFCLIYGRASDGSWLITSELSPDSMRIRNAAGDSYDKDLFRHGEPEDLLRSRWQELVERIGEA